MTAYTITACNPHKHFIDIEVKIQTDGRQDLHFQLPSWRPGRYELANYAQNIQKWAAYDTSGKKLRSVKLSKDLWEVNCAGTQEVTIQYNYYAYQLDAGASYYDIRQLYVNPVNCLVYIPEKINDPCTLKLNGLPDNYQIACGLNFDKTRLTQAQDYHSLADSPFFASDELLHETYDSAGYTFHIWIKGRCKPDWEQMKKDFKAFSDVQVDMFGELPVKEYHFLFQLPDHKMYHGVEHLNSTVICVGPGFRLMNPDIYTEFLGISSHELFHSWNIKSIRPAEMFPYDYTKENYSNLGYVAEGVTTYYGDLMLLRSGAYNWHTYSQEKSKFMQRHFHNYGRLFQTLAEASFDSWLDGYKAGVPDRKISFYVKGMLVAYMLDMKMRELTGNKQSLDDVMRELYHDFAKKGRGFTEEDYLEIVNRRSGKDFRNFFEKYVWGLEPIEEPLREAFAYVGCRLDIISSLQVYEDKLGFRVREESGPYRCFVNQIAPGSPADVSELSLDDQIIAINNIQIDGNLDELFKYFEGQSLQLTIFRQGHLMKFSISESDQHHFPHYILSKDTKVSDEAKANYKAWCGKDF